MPLFEYVCNECRTPFEILHKTAERPELVECPSCHAKDATKQFSSFSARIRGASSSAPPCASSACPGGACDMPYSSACAGGACGLD